MKKRLLSLALAVVMVMSLFTGITVTAGAAADTAINKITVDLDMYRLVNYQGWDGDMLETGDNLSALGDYMQSFDFYENDDPCISGYSEGMYFSGEFGSLYIKGPAGSSSEFYGASEIDAGWYAPTTCYTDDYILKANDVLGVRFYGYVADSEKYYFPFEDGLYSGQIVDINGDAIEGAVGYEDMGGAVKIYIPVTLAEIEAARTEGVAQTYMVEPDWEEYRDSLAKGSFGALPQYAKAGDTVTIYVYPKAGCEVDTVTVSGVNTVTPGENNTYTFTMPAADVQVSVAYTGDSSTSTPKTWNWSELKHGDVLKPGDKIYNDLPYNNEVDNSAELYFYDRNYRSDNAHFNEDTTYEVLGSYEVDDFYGDVSYTVTATSWTIMEDYFGNKVAVKTEDAFFYEKLDDPTVVEGEDGKYTVTFTDKEEGYEYFVMLMADLYWEAMEECSNPDNFSTYVDEQFEFIGETNVYMLPYTVRQNQSMPEADGVYVKNITNVDSFEYESSCMAVIYKAKKVNETIAGKTNPYYVEGAVCFGAERLARPITVEAEHGTIALYMMGSQGAVDEAKEFDVVFVVDTPDEGYELSSLEFVAADGEEVMRGGSMFLMPRSAVTVTATFVAPTDDDSVISEVTATFNWTDIDPTDITDAVTFSPANFYDQMAHWVYFDDDDDMIDLDFEEISELPSDTKIYAHVAGLLENGYTFADAIEINGVPYECVGHELDAYEVDGFNVAYMLFEIGTPSEVLALFGDEPADDDSVISEVTVDIDWDKITYNEEGYPELTEENILLAPDAFAEGVYLDWGYYDEEEADWFSVNDFADLPADAKLAIYVWADLAEGKSFADSPSISCEDGTINEYQFSNSDIEAIIEVGTKAEVEAIIGTFDGGEDEPNYEIETNIPDLDADGLDEEADAIQAEEEAKEENAGQDVAVNVKLTVETKVSTDVNADEKAEIEEVASTQSETLTYLDIVIKKTVTIDGVAQPEATIPQTKGLITIEIPFDTASKTDFKVYRYHGSDVQVLTEIANEAGEKIVVGEGKITVMAKFFSTYAIGYTETTGSDTPEFPVVPDVPVYPFLPPVVNTNETNCTKGNTCPMHPYVDLDKKLWYHNGVHYCIENGLMTGLSATQFAPNMETSRAMIVTILWRMENKPVVNYAMTFKDVAADMWYTEAIRWAQSAGIVEGYNDDAYGPNDSITREQLASILWRYAKYKGYDVSVGENTNILSYADAFDISSWAIPAMQWACGAGLISGIAMNNTMYLVPQGDAIRAQSATMIYYFCTEVKK